MKKYTVRTDCEIAGVWHSANDQIELTDAQARELAPPFGGVVKPSRATTEADDGGFDRSKRGNRKAAE